MKNAKTTLLARSSIIALLMATFLPQLGGVAQAATVPQFTTALVRLENLEAGKATGGTVCVTFPSSAWANLGSEKYVDVGFPTQVGASGTTFTLAAFGGWSVNTTSDPDAVGTGSAYWPAGAQAWTGIVAPTSNSVAGSTVRFGIGTAITTAMEGGTFCFNFSAAVTNPATSGYKEAANEAGYVETFDNTGTPADAPSTYNSDQTPGTNGVAIMRSNWATDIVPACASPISNNGCDMITVNGVVPPLFIWTVNQNIDAYTGNLDPASVISTGGASITVQTNAKSGWIAWAKDTETSIAGRSGLCSVSANYCIPWVAWNATTPTALAGSSTGGATAQIAEGVAFTAGPNTECSDVTTGTPPFGTFTGGPLGTYDGNPGATTPTYGGALFQHYQEIGSCNAQSVNPTNTDGGTTITLTQSATINYNVPAATDYTNTIEVVGAGNF